VRLSGELLGAGIESLGIERATAVPFGKIEEIAAVGGPLRRAEIAVVQGDEDFFFILPGAVDRADADRRLTFRLTGKSDHPFPVRAKASL
jgi:hypothetical protein